MESIVVLIAILMICLTILGWKFITEYFYFKRLELKRDEGIAERALKERKK